MKRFRRFSRFWGVFLSTLLLAAVLAGRVSAQINYSPSFQFSTLAGSPQFPGTADGPAQSAQFSAVSGVAVDAGGNLYVADTGNNSIRKITPDGVVSTIAGLAARLDGPTDVAVDANGNVFVADSYSCTIRKITPAGVVSTYAGAIGISGFQDGTGVSARFSFPQGIAVDAQGNVYVADSANEVIRKISTARVVTTIAGIHEQAGAHNGDAASATFDFPTDVAVDNKTGNIFVADHGNALIRLISPNGLTVSTYAGQTDSVGTVDGTTDVAKLYTPFHLDLDAAGSLYIADDLGGMIRKISAQGVVSSLGGQPNVNNIADGTGGQSLFNYPSGIAVDAVGNLFIADFSNYVIRKGVTFQAATLSLSVSDSVYDGSAKAATVTTNPAGLNVVVTYEGSLGGATTTPPTNADEYHVVATINDPQYQGSAEADFSITTADQQISGVANTAAVAVGEAFDLSGPTASSGMPVTFSFINDPLDHDTDLVANGVLVAQLSGTNNHILTVFVPGQITIYAHQQGNSNFNPATSAAENIGATMQINVVLGNLDFTYDDTPKMVTATTDHPELDLPINLTYNGSIEPPIQPGTYAVKAVIDDPNKIYTGTATGTMTIGPDANVTLSGLLTTVYNGRPHGLTASSQMRVKLITITYNGSTTAPTLAGVYNVVATVTDPVYGGSATATLTITAPLPGATTGLATLVSARSATLNASVAPNGSLTSAHFEYGTLIDAETKKPVYDHFTSTQIVGSVTAPFAAGINSLDPAMLYHFRVVATSDAGTFLGADRTFITLGAPMITDNPAPYLSGTGAEVVQSVNPNGVATSVAFQYGTTTAYGSATTPVNIGGGKVPVNVFALFPGLLPNTTYHYRLMTTSAAGTFFGEDHTFTTSGFDTSLVAQAGEDADGSPSSFATFGPPIVNAADSVAFYATLKLTTGVTAANNAGIWVDNGPDQRNLMAQIGAAAPDTGGNFATLGNPVSNDNSAIAFRGALKALAGQVTALNANGIWSNSSGAMRLVARQGFEAPGTGGANFNAFNGLGLTNSAGAVIFATLSGTGVTAANNTGIWEGNSTEDLHLVVRLGDAVNGKTITKMTFMPTVTFVNGQTRCFNTNGGIVCGATFSDKTTGLVRVVNGAAQIEGVSGDAAAGVDSATYATFGNAAINDNGNTAFMGTLTAKVGVITAANSTGIWADDSTGTRQLVAQTGADVAPGTGASFATLNEPIYNNHEAVAFRGTLKATIGQVTVANATGIWATSGNASGLALVARQGVTQAAGCPTGATYNTFTELALADQGGAANQGGAIFLATLNANAAAGVTAANSLGIWAVDNSGTLQLIVRTGDLLNLGTVEAPLYKTITGIAFLPVTTVTNGQSRSVAQSNGDIIYVATFSDKTTAILSVVF